MLRLEGLALLLVALWAYGQWGTVGWGWAALLFWAPDLAMLAYLAGARAGALVYNAAHSTLGAWTLLLWSVWQHDALCTSLALLWLGHIGLDRALGYGLKSAHGFRWTHLGRIGKHPSEQAVNGRG